MPLKCIRLELARDPEFPLGSPERGYEFAAPLDDSGRLVPAEWRMTRSRCRVTQFCPGDIRDVGCLVWRAGVWAFDYDAATDEDHAGFKLGTHRFISGEYVAFRASGGVKRTFRIARIADLE